MTTPLKKRQKRKNKNSRFMRNAKGFAKQGIYGRGTHIEDDEYNYFINILDAMKAGFDDVEDKVNMANNVFDQTKTKEIYLASNQIVCKALESLIGYVNAENLERFFTTFADNFRPICSDRFASHVLQKMVEIAFLRAMGKDNLKSKHEVHNESGTPAKRIKAPITDEMYNLDTDFATEHRKNCCEFVERVAKFLLNNLEDFVWDSCANHIIRTCILCLAGVHVPKIAFEKGGTEMAKNKTLYTVSSAWSEILLEFPERLQMWPHFADFPYHEQSSALLGVIAIALREVNKDLLKHFGKKILMDGFLKVDGDDEKIDTKIEISDGENEPSEAPEQTVENNAEIKLPKVFEYQSSIVLLETLLTVAGAKLLTQLYAMLFTGRVAKLAEQPFTNFAVQKLLQHIKEKKDFENIFEELSPQTEDLLKIGHTGVVLALSDACLRLCTKQAQMIVALQMALHVVPSDKEKSKHFFCCLYKLKPYEVVIAESEQKSTFVHLHGSLVVQNILKFNKPIFLVTCILDTAPNQLCAIFNTPNGSHISDAFLVSKFIGEKSREKLIKNLEGFYVDLAITKAGSRVVENLFNAAQESQQTRIVKELADKTNMLKGSPFGRLLHSKLNIDTYRLSVPQWRAKLQKNEQNAENVFKDIIKP